MALIDESAWRGKIFLGGWAAGGGGDGPVTEPATGQEIGRIGMAAPADVTRAAQVAAAAQPGWAARPHTERSAILRKAAGLWLASAADIEPWGIAPADVLLASIATRTSNPYGKRPEEQSLISHYLAEVEPRLRTTATIEIDASAPLAQVVQQLEDLP
jgi:benzaldehyde dehydrogenase (NAD)